jgi:hypothetical protein
LPLLSAAVFSPLSAAGVLLLAKRQYRPEKRKARRLGVPSSPWRTTSPPQRPSSPFHGGAAAPSPYGGGRRPRHSSTPRRYRRPARFRRSCGAAQGCSSSRAACRRRRRHSRRRQSEWREGEMSGKRGRDAFVLKAIRMAP